MEALFVAFTLLIAMGYMIACMLATAVVGALVVALFVLVVGIAVVASPFVAVYELIKWMRS